MMYFLKTLLSLSASGTMLILFLFLIKPFLKNRVSKKWLYYVWLIVIARLLLPYSPEIGLMNKGFQKIASSQAYVTDTEPSIQPAEKSNVPFHKILDTGRTGDPLPEEVGLYSTINGSSSIQLCIWAIWFVIALILFLRKVQIYHKFSRYIKRESTEVSAIEYLELLGNTVEHMNIKRTIGLYTNNYVSSPLLIGILKVKIVLPTLDLDNTEHYYTLLHELTHYKRRDMLYKWLVQFTICLHWFNPFVYLMGREINHACELSCDEEVIKNLNYEKKRNYGDTLLNAVKTGGNNNSLATVTLIENKKLIKERLDCIMNYKKKTKAITIMMILLTLLLCGGAVILGAYHSGKPAEAKVKDELPEINNDTAIPKENTFSNSEAAEAELERSNMDEKPIDRTIQKTDATGTGLSIQADGYNIVETKGYYEDSYVFLIEWHKNNAKTEKYTAKAKLKLSDQSEITVYFDASCKNDAKDKNVLAALQKLFNQMEDYPEAPGITNAKPVITRTLYVGTNLKQVAEEYYTKNDIWVFYSVFPELDSKLQKQYAEKAFNDDKISVFAVASDTLDEEEIKTYAKKAYDDNRINFFAVLSENLDKEEIKTYAEKAYDDNRINFFAVLSENLDKEEIKTYAEKAYNDNRIDFFAVIENLIDKS